jgi:hypothetical protein
VQWWWWIHRDDFIRRGLIATAAILVVAYVWAAQHAPVTVLSYTKALVWPAVAALAIILLRRPILGLLQGTVLEEIAAGPVRARVAQRVEGQPAEDPEDLRRQLEQRQLGVTVLFNLNAAYQLQIDFLKHLQRAPEGLTEEASLRYFTEAIREKGLDPDKWDVSALFSWLRDQNLIWVRPDDAWELSNDGRSLVEIVNLPNFLVRAEARLSRTSGLPLDPWHGEKRLALRGRTAP